MLKKVVFIVLLLSIKTFAKAGDEQKVQTALQKIIVFLNGAQVTRTAKVQVKPGTSTIVFENLSPGIDVPSIQVHAAGEFTILSVKQELNYLNEQVKQQHVEELKAIQKDIADKVGLDISTVSRVANSKYVQTPYGTFLLKTFFSESLSTDGGEEVSTREVKKILQDCIANENKKKPLTDDALCEILKEKKYMVIFTIQEQKTKKAD